MTDNPNPTQDELRQRPGASAEVFVLPPSGEPLPGGFIAADLDPTPQTGRIVARIVAETRSARKLSLRDFAAEFSGPMSSLSHQVVKDWEDGQPPRVRTILPMIMLFDDWRRDFALDLLAALNPGVNVPATEIGRAAITPPAAQ